MPYVIEGLLIATAIALIWELVDFLQQMEAGDDDA
jgi:hypothetical protein